MFGRFLTGGGNQEGGCEEESFAATDVKRALEMVQRALACKSAAIDTANAKLEMVLLEMETLRNELQKEREQRQSLERDLELLGGSVQDHCKALCEYLNHEQQRKPHPSFLSITDKGVAVHRPGGNPRSSGRNAETLSELTAMRALWTQLSPQACSLIPVGQSEKRLKQHGRKNDDARKNRANGST